MSIFNPNSMVPVGWTAEEWAKERVRVSFGGQKPSEKGKRAGLKRISFDIPEGEIE